MIFNEKRRLLIVKPTYKEGWSLPGGTVDADESPRAACLREVKEEIGINISKIEFIGVDYQKKEEYSESLHFMFYGGALSNKQIEKIKLQLSELSEYKFVEISEATKMLSANLGKRVENCLEAIDKHKAIYFENAEII